NRARLRQRRIVRQALQQRVDRVRQLPFRRCGECIGPDAGSLYDGNSSDVDLLAPPRGARRIDAEQPRDALGVQVITSDAKLDLQPLDVSSRRISVGGTGHAEALVARASR